MTKTVMVAWPNTGWLHQDFTMYTLPMLMQDGRYNLRLSSGGHKCNENNYQHIAKMFWESDADYLLQFDFDNPPLKNPLDLVEKDYDVVAGPYPIWCYHAREQTGRCLRPIHWSVYRWMSDSKRYLTMDPKNNVIEECDAIGAGCTLIAKRVFDAPLMRREGWHRIWHKKDGTAKYGLDLGFSQRAKKCGFKIWVAWEYVCHHYKEVDLLQVVDGFDQWVRTIPELIPYFENKHDSARLAQKSQPILVFGDDAAIVAGILDRLGVDRETDHAEIDQKRRDGLIDKPNWTVSVGYMGQERIKKSKLWYLVPEEFHGDYLTVIPGAKVVMTELHPERIDGRPYMLFELNGSPEGSVNALAGYVGVEPKKEAVEWLKARMERSR